MRQCRNNGTIGHLVKCTQASRESCMKDLSEKSHGINWIKLKEEKRECAKETLFVEIFLI